MRRFSMPILILGCLTTLLFSCYGAVLFRGEQFGYRDSAHFYYPLDKRVQDEWSAGRWPLWESEENGGMPLLGQPSAAVLYPGKLIYAVLPYAWGTRIYTVAHTVLAFAGMLALMRTWGTSWTSASIAGLSFAFGAPILFQYCNIIFLVGAAWIPWGLRAVDRWVRQGRRWGLIELALVLAVQSLGGDPESAYVIGLCAGGYALGLTWQKDRAGAPRARVWPLAFTGLAVAAFWVAATLLLAYWLPEFRATRTPMPPLPWMRWVPPGIALGWGLVGLVFLVRWKKRGWVSPLGTMLVGLAGAAVLGAALMSVQLLPIVEFARQSGRAASAGSHDIYSFGLEPARTIEFLWPNVFGTHFAGNRSWFDAIPPFGHHAKLWVPSLYLGGLPILLALGTLGFQKGAPWRGWLTAIAAISLLASFGEYASPIWWGRCLPELASAIGAHDDLQSPVIRDDGQLRDGDGGLYWLMATVLPGFKQFRFPSKLLSFTVLALAGLAGLGWDRLREQGSRRVFRLAVVALGLTLVALAVAFVEKDQFLAALSSPRIKKLGSSLGPIEPLGAYGELIRSLVHGSIVFSLVVLLTCRIQRWPVLASSLALIGLTADLALANARHVVSVPQSMLAFDDPPKLVELIRQAERDKPSDGPYRVHRMPIWNPLEWPAKASSDRVRDFVRWERETIQPKYGINFGIEYTLTIGTAELYDYEWFFGGFRRAVDADMANFLGIKTGEKVIVFPRRAYDLWNTRYFLLPYFPNGWKDENRGFASFLPDTERIYPPVDAFRGPDAEAQLKDWVEREDYQLLRNLAVYPRSWIVHSARGLKPLVGMEWKDRNLPMLEILYADDDFWKEPGRPVFDPRSLAWLDSDEKDQLTEYLPGSAPGLSERVSVTSHGPQRVELDAVLERPGLVILADVYYPGWKLSIDGSPAPIYRANRLMRGAAVKSGRHHLVFTYEPRSFLVGSWISLAGIAVLVLLGAFLSRHPLSRRLAPVVS